MSKRLNLQSYFFVYLFGALTPFINQSFVNLFSIPSYYIYVFLLTFRFIRLAAYKSPFRLTPPPAILSIFYLLSLISFLSTGSLTAFLSQSFILLFTLIVASRDFSRLLSSPSHFSFGSPLYLSILSYSLLFLDFKGVLINIYNSSRMGTQGSVLGLSVLFSVLLILTTFYLLESFSILWLLNSLCCLFILSSVLASKGPLFCSLLILFYVIVYLKKNAFFLRLYSVVSFLVFIAFALLRRGFDDNGSFSSRLDIYLSAISHIHDQPLLNIVYELPFRFHNWILESYLAIGPLSLLICILLFVYLLWSSRRSKFASIAALFYLVGLFSFELDDITLSLSISALLIKAEAKILPAKY